MLLPAPATAGAALEYFQRGLTERAAGQGKLAARSFQDAWEIEPDGPLAPDALFFAADARDTMLGDFEIAVSLYGALIERHPHSRRVPRARERLAFLEHARASGDEALRRYVATTRRYAELGSDEALARMTALAEEFPDFVLADRLGLWIAAEHFRREEWEQAKAAYQQVRTRWPDTEVAALALEGVGDVAAAEARWGQALAAYRAIPTGPGGLDATQTASLIRTAEEQRDRAWLARAGAGYLAIFLGFLVAGTKWRDLPTLWRSAARDLSILAPPLALVLVLASGEHQIIFRSLAGAAGLYGIVATLNALYLESARLQRVARWLHGPFLVVALVACLYVACYANGLHLLLEATLRTGPD